MADIDKIANNSVFTLITRAAMIFVAFAVPAVGWMLQRSVNTVDQISAKVDTVKDQSTETNSTVKLIQQTQSVQSQIIADHESRVRILERLTPPPKPN